MSALDRYPTATVWLTSADGPFNLGLFACLFVCLFVCVVRIASPTLTRLHLSTAQVLIESPLAGRTYRITVSGANVPQGPQKFALVWPKPPLSPSAATKAATRLDVARSLTRRSDGICAACDAACASRAHAFCVVVASLAVWPSHRVSIGCRTKPSFTCSAA